MIDKLKDLAKELLKNLNAEAIGEFLGRLNQRERYIVYACAGGLGLLIVLVLITTAMATLSGMETKIEQRRDDVRRMQTLRGKFAEIDNELRRLEGIISRTGAGFSITTYLENLAKENGVQIQSVSEKMAPPNNLYTERQVEVNLKQIYLRNLIDFLYRIENSPQLLRIKTLQIKPNYSNPLYLNVVFSVSTFEPVG